MNDRNAALFAGQGAQAVGMGRDLAESRPECKALFDRADSILGWSLSEAVFEGPIERLTRTDVCQPAELGRIHMSADEVEAALPRWENNGSVKNTRANVSVEMIGQMLEALFK